MSASVKQERKQIATKDACLVLAGQPVEILASADDPKQTTPSAPKFRMLIYTGAVFANHWYWGDVIMDVAGFKPRRQDLAAMENHYETVGFTTSIKSDPAAVSIVIEGQILSGDPDIEPAAARVRNRIEQKFPFQASGRWQPKKVEQVQAGATSSVNGKTVNGPVAIFREFDILEASFCEMGWDGMTAAVAASKNENQAVDVEIESMSDKKNPILGLVALLAGIFGSDKALVLAEKKPEASTLGDFAEDLAAEVKATRTELTDIKAKLATAETKVTDLQAQLTEAKKNPPVVTGGGDPSKHTAPAADPNSVEALEAKWKGSEELKTQFPIFGWYKSHMESEAAKTAKA